LERRIEEGEREVRKLKGDIENLRSDLEREQTINRQLKVPHLTPTNSLPLSDADS
jgi:hypothetical protein